MKINIIAILITLIIISFLLMTVGPKLEHFISNRLYLAGPTKCFSCERDMINRYGPEYAYIGQPTKCFSCEKQLGNNLGPNYANFGQPTKCFSCEQQFY